MKVRIRKAFRDIDTGKLMRVGEGAELPLERAKKLARSGFVIMLEPEPEAEDLDNTKDISEVEETPVVEEETVENDPAEKDESDHFPEKDENSGPKKRGRKPKQ